MTGVRVSHRVRNLGLSLLLPIALAACQKADKPAAAADVLANPAAVTQERVDTTNVGTLGLVWHADYDTNLDQHGTPLYVDGVLYVSTAWDKVYAFDAKTGKQLWQYNAKVPGEWLRNVCCGNVSRGLAAYNGKIYIGT